ncbi:hypothetical protein ACWCV4_37515, partial [Streptomyces yangpuensis]
LSPSGVEEFPELDQEPQDEASPPGTTETRPRAPSRGDTPPRPPDPAPPRPYPAQQHDPA